MNTIKQAAIHLLQAINLPTGAVNAMPVSAVKNPYILLLVAPGYLQRVENIPKKIDGYRVEVEARGEARPAGR